jgi:hypothetical protein
VPQRVIPATTKRQIELPDDLEIIKGTLADLEELLGVRKGRAV